MAKRLHTNPILVGAESATSMATIVDRPDFNTLVAGYMIILRGTFVGAVAVDPRTNLGLITVNSSVSGNHVTEENFGFITERTRAGKGSTRWINTAGAGNEICLTFILDYDISGNYSHGNVYPASPGEAISFTLPAIPAAVSIDAVWEVQRLQADRGSSIYLPRFNSTGFDLTKTQQQLEGAVALIQMQETSGTNPSRLTILDGNEVQKAFLTWSSALAYTNAMFDFDQSEVTDFMFATFSADPQSMTKVMANTQMKLRASGGTGTSAVSVCTIDGTPQGAKEMASKISVDSMRVSLDRIALSEDVNKQSSARVAMGLSQTSAPVGVSEQKQSAKLAVQPKSALV